MKITLVSIVMGPGAESVMSELANYLVAKGTLSQIVTLSAHAETVLYF